MPKGRYVVGSCVLAAVVAAGVLHSRSPPLTKELLAAAHVVPDGFDTPEPVSRSERFVRAYGAKALEPAMYVAAHARRGRSPQELYDALFALSVLRELKDPRARPFLERLRKDASARDDVRSGAEGALLGMPGYDAVPMLLEWLDSGDAPARSAAAFVALKSPDERLLEPIRRAALAEQDPAVRSELRAVQALLEHPGMCSLFSAAPEGRSPACLYYCRGEAVPFETESHPCAGLVPEADLRVHRR
jgi:HEAT repeat protein